LGVHLIAPVDRHSLLAITVLPKRPFLPKGGSTRTLTPGSGILLAAGEPHTETQDGQNAVPSERSSHDHHPGDFEALRRMPGALLALLRLYGLGIGAIIRHSAGAIATFVQSSQRLGAVLRDAAGSPSRFMPKMIYAHSAAESVLLCGVPSSAICLLRRAVPTTVAVSIGGGPPDRRYP
jgi:hypothetical protein